MRVAEEWVPAASTTQQFKPAKHTVLIARICTATLASFLLLSVKA
jgi:hypothetical protein